MVPGKMQATEIRVNDSQLGTGRGKVTREHWNRVAARKRSLMKRPKNKIMLPREAILGKVHIMVLTRDSMKPA